MYGPAGSEKTFVLKVMGALPLGHVFVEASTTRGHDEFAALGATLPQLRARKVLFIPDLIPQPDWDKYHFRLKRAFLLFSALFAPLSPPLPTLSALWLTDAAIGDAGLVALAPALRRRPALERLYLIGNPFGDEGLAALVAPPPPAGTPPLPTGGLKKLRRLDLGYTQVTDAGCAALAAALDSGTLPALVMLQLNDIPASAAAIDAVTEAVYS